MFSIFLGSQPEKFLKGAEKEIRERVWQKFDELKSNPFPSGVVRVISKKGKAFRVRVGKYRIQYYVFRDKREIVVFDIDIRGKAYD